MYRLQSNGLLICYCSQCPVLNVNIHTNVTETTRVACKARVGETHSHPPISKLVIELHLFRWACQLWVFQNLKSEPQKVVKAVAPSWPQLSKYMPSLLPKVLHSFSGILKKPMQEKNEIVNCFETYCNEEQLNKFKQLLQSQQPYWPLCHPTNSGKYCFLLCRLLNLYKFIHLFIVVQL